jgi:hypothetical protein
MPSHYWSTTKFNSVSAGNWYVDFSYGYATGEVHVITDSKHLRLVRGGR